jgi:hypothetical protein
MVHDIVFGVLVSAALACAIESIYLYIQWSAYVYLRAKAAAAKYGTRHVGTILPLVNDECASAVIGVGAQSCV